MALHEPATEASGLVADRGVHWVRSTGVELLGEATGTGLTKPVFLVRRPDGQVVQLTELLYRVIDAADAPQAPEELAAAISARLGKELDVDGLNTLAGRLEPIGLLSNDGAAPPEHLEAAKPILALTLKGTLIPTRGVQFLAGVFRFLFVTPVVVAAVLAFVGLDVYLAFRADALQALGAVLVTPSALLALYGLIFVGTVFHEIGHAAACRYGGARPGVIGIGLYLVFPAFFTNVTDSYRLGRAGRIRTDLGGLYFNLLWVLAAGGAFLVSGSPFLLLVVIVTQLQMLQQLPPFVRLDGYFVLADLAGIPDLFARVKPVLTSLLPGRPTDPRVSELKPYSRWIVTVWVLTVVPFLTIVLTWLFITLPVVIGQTVQAAAVHVSSFTGFFASGRPVEAILAAIALVLLVLPVVGLCIILAQLAMNGVRVVSARLASQRKRRAWTGRHVRRNPRHRQAPTARA
jgi:putative peptide zinc metalloprotease protein